MKHLKEFKKFINEGVISTQPAPTKTPTPVKVPVKPQKPQKPDRIEKPSVDPEPKAEVTEEDVVERFANELSKKGDSIKNYMNK